MMLLLKKYIAKILVNNTTGSVISILYKHKIRFNNLIIDISNVVIKKKIAASLFFKTYESAEVRFISQYLQNYKGTIVELGSSIGVVTSTIAKANPDAVIFSFEADIRFIPVIENNLQLNKIQNVKCYNTIIGADGYVFSVGTDNTMGKIVKGESGLSNLKKLSSILQVHNITDFVLVSDIEGAEYFFLFEESDLFKNCHLMIIELHPIEINNELITVDEMIQKIKSLGFDILAVYGSNVVAKKIKLI
ncbi:FkbM family methyltransferase [Flavobacterium sp.]|jgi:FkbM family methyltransferase|uniref:FkbM family methyltransferase n=1 Tax=Flavobacterium sp. TaxID=239 RepID=UPI002A82FB8E|nr:FkbM family methyltransferase [Flavobacterium sp.]